MVGQRPVHVLRVAWLLAETSVEIRNELRRIGIGSFDRIDAAKPHLLDQPILQCLVRTSTRPLACGVLAQMMSMFGS